jgi:hypothetical protein
MNSIPWLIDSRLKKVVKKKNNNYINNTTKIDNNDKFQAVCGSSISGLRNVSNGSEQPIAKRMVSVGRIDSKASS